MLFRVRHLRFGVPLSFYDRTMAVNVPSRIGFVSWRSLSYVVLVSVRVRCRNVDGRFRVSLDARCRGPKPDVRLRDRGTKITRRSLSVFQVDVQVLFIRSYSFYLYFATWRWQRSFEWLVAGTWMFVPCEPIDGGRVADINVRQLSVWSYRFHVLLASIGIWWLHNTLSMDQWLL